MRRVKGRNRSLARGRMFLQGRLGWLPGFPIRQQAEQVLWVPAPQLGMALPTAVALGREELHRATYIWTKLVYRFPYALPKLVPDYGRWVEGVPQLFSWLKQAIHHDKPLPSSLWQVEAAFAQRITKQAISLQQQTPDLAPLLNALSWVMFLQPQETSRVLDWVGDRKTAVCHLLSVQPGPDSIITLLILYQLQKQHGTGRVDPIWHYLADPGSFRITMRNVDTYLNKWAHVLRAAANKNQEKQPPQLAKPQLGNALLSFVNWLATQNRSTCRRALELFALLPLTESLSMWQAWWEAKEPIFEKAGQLAAKTLTTTPLTNKLKKDARKQAQQFDIWAKNAPPPLHSKQLLQSVQHVASTHTNLHKPLCTFLDLLPAAELNNALLHPAFLHYWRCVADERPLHAPALLTQFCEYMQHGTDASRLMPWVNEIRDWWKTKPGYVWGLTYEILDELPGQRLWSLFFSALVIIVTSSETAVTEDQATQLILLVKVTADADLAAAYLKALAMSELRDDYLTEDVLQCAHLLDGGRGQFSQFAQQVYAFEDGSDKVATTVLEVAIYLEKLGWTRLAGDLIVDNELAALVLAGQKLAALQKIGSDVAPPQPLTAQIVPEWCQRYPTRFQPALVTLVGVADDADKIADNVLGKQYPDLAKLKRQIVALDQKIIEQPDNVALAKRLANLQQQLVSSASVSPQRQARLQAKLERAVRRTVLQTWQQQLDAALEVELCRLLQVEMVPEILLQSTQLELITHLFALREPFFRLAIRLIQVRCGPPPWNMIDDPKNKAFVLRLRQLGINPEPWLLPPAPRTFTGKNSRVVTLSFATDPLHIFQMGAHFNTCLSPGAFNFFSVFANAADINKHVVYAHDQRGQVVGRCLLAVTNMGGLLTFSPYCHDGELGFDDMMSQVANELAAAMSTAVILNGHVPTLVAPDWYDDGPRDLCNRFDFLQVNSPFYKSLSNIELDALIPTLAKQFVPLPLNTMTLTLVLHMLATHERAELIRPLLPLLATCKELVHQDWMIAARLANAAGEHEFAHQVLQQKAVPYLLQQHRRQHWLDYTIVEILAERAPSLALRVLRQTRLRHIRSDADETDPRRRALLAQALLALGRTNQAEQLQTTSKSLC